MQLELGPRGINTDGLKRLSQLPVDNQMLDVRCVFLFVLHETSLILYLLY